MPSRFEYERAVRSSDLPSLSRLLALTLATWADVRTGRIPPNLTPSLTMLEEATGMDRSTVRRHLNKLEASEWVVRDRPDPIAARAKKARTRYRLMVPKGITVPESDGYELGAENTKARGTVPLVEEELGAHSPQARGTQPPELGAENTKARGTVPPNSSFKTTSTTTSPSSPSEKEIAREASAPGKVVALRGKQQLEEQPEHLDAFGAFWLVYPKKRAKEEARKAWVAAIKRGAEPKHIVDAAQAYARERFQQDPKFTKYPATWLNKGCYDDEPEATYQPRSRRQEETDALFGAALERARQADAQQAAAEGGIW